MEGLNVPSFSTEVREALASYSMRGGVGLCVGNPVDLSGEVWKITYDCAKTMLDYPGIDILISQLSLNNHPNFFEGIYETIVNSVEELIRAAKYSKKPNVLVVPVPISNETFHVVTEFRRKCHEAGIPAYNSMAGAAKAIAMLANYQENQEQLWGEK
jgi:acyl-CoA synthetase (NDP forming)